MIEKLLPFFQALENIEFGSIDIELPDGSKHFFRAKIINPKAKPEAKIINLKNKLVKINAVQNFDDFFNPQSHLKIKDLSMISQSLIKGDIGFGESYMEEMWESEDLSKLLLFFALNKQSLENFFHANKLKTFFLIIENYFRRNTRKGSKKNISTHYDLGNDFYKLWLDSTMTYSSAIFNDHQESLEQAQKNKYNRILSKIEKPSEILEIGCGWGGFASLAVQKEHGITCLTLSQEQAKFIDNFIKKDRIKVKIQDYRDEKNLFDYIVSIEMFEAVGKEYWNNYFQTIHRCLKKDGKAIIQTIVIDEEVYDDYQKRVDFIQKHIFPGGFLPSKTIFKKFANDNNLNVTEEFNFGLDYYKTIENWLNNFNDKLLQISNDGFSKEFIKKWQFYLAYCMAGFASARISVMQFELCKN